MQEVETISQTRLILDLFNEEFRFLSRLLGSVIRDYRPVVS